MTITVVLVDDQPMMREAFRTIFEAHDIDVVGDAGDGAEALEVVAATRPDVVVMDVRMPIMNGIDATSRLRAQEPSLPVLVLTTFDDDDGVFGALDAGAAGFLLKNSTVEELVSAIRRVADGDAVLDPAITRRVLSRLSSNSVDPEGALDRLTEREKDVLSLLTHGLTNGEIAERIGSEPSTVKTHVSSLLAKLGVRDRVRAVIWAYETGFAPSDRPIG